VDNHKVLFDSYLKGKAYNNTRHFDKHTEDFNNDSFFVNMYDGMTFFLDFLNDPIKYCEKFKCTFYSDKNEDDDSNIIYFIVNNIDDERYILITLNFEYCLSHYIVTDYNNIEFETKNRQSIKFETIKECFVERKMFFENEFININGLIDEYNNPLDDVKKTLRIIKNT